jgi:hypothetical protein
MNETFFQEKHSSKVRTSVGELQLPLEYHDAEAMASFFPVAAADLFPLLPSADWKPVLIRPNIALLGIALLEFKKTSVGAYNLGAVFVPCLWKPTRNFPLLPFLFPNWFPHLSAFIYQMPTTMEFAARACSEIWGSPLFLADIDFEDYDFYRVGRLAHEGQSILRVSLQKPALQRFQRRKFPLLSRKNEWALRTKASTQGLMGIIKSSTAIEIQFGTHPLGRQLAALKPGPAFRSYYYPKLQGMIDWPSRAYPTGTVASR